MGGGGGERMIKHITLTGSINYAAFMENNLAILIEALNIFNSFTIPALGQRVTPWVKSDVPQDSSCLCL